MDQWERDIMVRLTQCVQRIADNESYDSVELKTELSTVEKDLKTLTDWRHK